MMNENYECSGQVVYVTNARERITPSDGHSCVSSGDTGTAVLFGSVLRLSPTKRWPVASGPWYLP